MRKWKVQFRDELEDVFVEAESVCCEGGVAFFYVLDEAKYGSRNRTVATVPLDAVLMITEAR